MSKLSYAKAITLGLREAMAEDPGVFCLGEDVGYGGAYGATQGLRDEFGAARVRDTPISESAIVGFSVGAAMAGLRPVAEIMHMDFIACAMDQVVNQAAKARYMFGGKARVPMVIRAGTGGWLNAAAQHSQSLEAWFTHIPGLKVATAAAAADIRALLLAAIRDDNPVIVMEPLSLYEAQGRGTGRPGRAGARPGQPQAQRLRRHHRHLGRHGPAGPVGGRDPGGRRRLVRCARPDYAHPVGRRRGARVGGPHREGWSSRIRHPGAAVSAQRWRPSSASAVSTCWTRRSPGSAA